MSGQESLATTIARRVRVHCIGGIIGAIGTGIVAAPFLGGTGVFDYTLGKVGVTT